MAELSGGPIQFALRANNAVSEVVRIREIKISRQSALEMPTASIDNDVSGGGLAPIKEDGGHAVFVNSSLDYAISPHLRREPAQIEIAAFSGDVSTQLLLSIRNSDLVSGNAVLNRVSGGLNRGTHIPRLLVSGSAQAGGFGEQTLRGAIQQPGKKGQHAVEQNQKWIGPTLFILSFFVTLFGSSLNYRFGSWAIPILGFGWLILIIFGIL